MTSTETASELRFEPPGPGFWTQDPVHFPRPDDAVLGGDPSRGFQARHRRLRPLLRDADRRSRGRVRQRLRVPAAATRTGERAPRALRSARSRSSRESSGASSFATGTRRSSRPRSRRTASCRQSTLDALSRRELADYLDALPRPPRGDDRPAHALHGIGGGPDGRLPRTRRGLDRSPARRAARPDARRVARVGGRVLRARADDRRRRGGSPPRRSSSRRTTIRPPCSTPCARTRAKPAQPCPRISTSSATGCSTDSTSRSLRARDARRAAPRDPDGGRRRCRRGHRSRRGGRLACATRCRRSIEPQFDELLGEARLTYRLRDERGVFSDIWASGIMRRAALAAGRRLADRGRIHDAGALRRRGSRRDGRRCWPARTSPRRTSSPHALRVPRLAHGQGRAADAGHPATASTGPVRAAAGHRDG